MKTLVPSRSSFVPVRSPGRILAVTLGMLVYAASAGAGGPVAVPAPQAGACPVFMTESECRGHVETLARLKGAELLTYLAVTEATLRERAWLCGGGRQYMRMAGLAHR